jgi:hypothetical protein
MKGEGRANSVSMKRQSLRKDHPATVTYQAKRIWFIKRAILNAPS